MVSNNSWEGCDGCTEQDEAMYKNGYAKGYNAAIAEFPKEISDEEIQKAIDAYFPKTDINARWGWKLGCEWYREQLKNK